MTAISSQRFARATLLAAALTALGAVALDGQSRRPMTFMDMQLMRSAGSPAVSPDGKWLLYTLSVADWKEAKRFTTTVLILRRALRRLLQQRRDQPCD